MRKNQGVFVLAQAFLVLCAAQANAEITIKLLESTIELRCKDYEEYTRGALSQLNQSYSAFHSSHELSNSTEKAELVTNLYNEVRRHQEDMFQRRSPLYCNTGSLGFGAVLVTMIGQLMACLLGNFGDARSQQIAAKKANQGLANKPKNESKSHLKRNKYAQFAHQKKHHLSKGHAVGNGGRPFCHR